ncbi:MAG: hypothetical protein AAF438_06370 [Pseudomonadota bacterium]
MNLRHVYCASRTSLILISILSFLSGCISIDFSSDTAAPEQILGTWKVDLRPTPDAKPYFQEFVVTSIEGSSFIGTFYGTPVSEGRINTDWGKVRIAFVTTDGSGAYNHSAVLEGDTLEGLSNSTGRDFLSYWSAEKD